MKKAYKMAKYSIISDKISLREMFLQKLWLSQTVFFFKKTVYYLFCPAISERAKELPKTLKKVAPWKKTD